MREAARDERWGSTNVPLKDPEVGHAWAAVRMDSGTCMLTGIVSETEQPQAIVVLPLGTPRLVEEKRRLALLGGGAHSQLWCVGVIQLSPGLGGLEPKDRNLEQRRSSPHGSARCSCPAAVSTPGINGKFRKSEG